jgi:hypothetical protein
MTNAQIKDWYAEASLRWQRYGDLVKDENTENRKAHRKIAAWMLAKSKDLKHVADKEK